MAVGDSETGRAGQNNVLLNHSHKPRSSALMFLCCKKGSAQCNRTLVAVAPVRERFLQYGCLMSN